MYRPAVLLAAFLSVNANALDGAKAEAPRETDVPRLAPTAKQNSKVLSFNSLLEKPVPAALLGGGVLLVGSGLVLQVLSSSAWGSFNANAPQANQGGAAQFQQLQSLQARATTEHTLALLCGALGIGSLFAGTYMFWNSWFTEPPSYRGRVRISVEPRPAGMLLSIRWP
jgi:hypothetical protein